MIIERLEGLIEQEYLPTDMPRAALDLEVLMRSLH